MFSFFRPLLLLMLTIGLASGCQERPALALLEGTAWTLTQYRDAEGVLLADAYGTLAFTTDRLSASSCNDCGLSYAFEDGVLRVSGASCTERACATGQQFEVGERLAEAMLARVVLDDEANLLLLSGRDGATFTFRRLDTSTRTAPGTP